MTIEQKRVDDELILTLNGRLDTLTAPQLDETLKGQLDGIRNLVLDMTDVEYISSAGLRVLLAAHKTMQDKGSMVVRHVNKTVSDILELTGFSDILKIEY